MDSEQELTQNQFLDLTMRFMRYIYNTEFRFHGEGEYILAAESLSTRFIDFCKYPGSSGIEFPSIYFSSSAFESLFVKGEFQVKQSALHPGFLIFNLSENEVSMFELQNVRDLMRKLDNLNSTNIDHSVEEIVFNGFTEKMVKFLKSIIQLSDFSEQSLTFVCLVLREIGPKFRDIFQVHFEAIVKELAKKIPLQKSSLRFLILDTIDFFKNKWLKRTESENWIDKEIIVSFILNISKGPFAFKRSFHRQFVKKKFSDFVKENYLEPRNLNVSKLCFYLLYSFSLNY